MADRVFFPFLHNWVTPYRATYEFLTEIITNDAGGEQRRALRSTPRKTLTSVVQTTFGRMREFNRFMATAQNMPVVAAEVSRRTFTIDAIADGDQTVMLSAVPDWITVGAEIVLRWFDTYRVAEVSAITGNELTLSLPVGAWAAGTEIYGCVTGQLPGQISLRTITDSVREGTIAIAVDPASESYDFGAPVEMLSEYEVFTWQPNWSDSIDTQLIWPVENVDKGWGRIETYRAVDFPTDVKSASYYFESAAEVEAFLQFFLRQKGRRGTFCASSGTSDLALATDIAANASSVLVEGLDLANDFANDPVRQAFEIQTRSGFIRREITTIAADGVNSRVSFDTPIPTAITRAQISLFSWIINFRFANDALEIEWLTDAVARTTVALQSLPAEGFGDYFALRATLQGDDRETLQGDSRAVIYL